MKRLISILLCLNIYSTYSQEVDTIPRVLSAEDFAWAKREYAKHTKSDEYKLRVQTSIKFFEKLPSSSFDPEIIKADDKVFFQYMVENLHSSKFSSAKEALEMRQEVFDLNRKIKDDNAFLYEMIRNASSEQALEILRPGYYPRDWQ